MYIRALGVKTGAFKTPVPVFSATHSMVPVHNFICI